MLAVWRQTISRCGIDPRTAERKVIFAIGFFVLALSFCLLILGGHRPYIGVDVVRRGDSYVVSQVDTNGLAYAAGVKQGDSVLAADGQSFDVQTGQRSGAFFRPQQTLTVVSRDEGTVLVKVEGSVAPWSSAVLPVGVFVILF